jgi:hypothetical protein
MENNPYAPTKAALNEAPFSDDSDLSDGLRARPGWHDRWSRTRVISIR